ncbi:phosphopantetheine-binding protein [Pseudomonas fluorescens]|jgi:acyl carrier protein|uniref:phosphopantetheine-binding protein n=1 Tax=Pseudomonas fluorescens TaxID=294 RepID=UPI000F486F2C|nr:phosphopantetheine-binding protein [Pseudomonas fluorescens]RON88396.1 hypothetical protein BK668_15645 [Pseudomonas fluorescens]
MNTEITKRVFAIVRNHLPADSFATAFDSDTELQTLGLDSLAVAGVIVSLEETFGLRFPSQRITRQTFESVRTICAAIEDLVVAASAASQP